MIDPLRDARAKLDRANFHVEALRRQIASVGDGQGYAVLLVKDSDEDSGELHLRMPDVPEIPKPWGLVIGDALHNFRSALDAVWWQLATAHLGREPAEDEAGKIQFPLSKPGGSFDFGTARKWVGDAPRQVCGRTPT